MIGVEVITMDMKQQGTPSDGVMAKLIKKHSFEKGLILETGGRHGAVLRFLPPLTINEAEIGDVLDRFENAVERASTRPMYTPVAQEDSYEKHSTPYRPDGDLVYRGTR
jgi:diaminobutyrate-2-oxoglutarate transaminase